MGSREFDSRLPDVASIDEAEHVFGPPTGQRVAEGGDTVSVWEFDRYEQVPGQYVDEKEFLGYDGDGFPVYRLKRYWVPFHVVGQYCRLEIVSGPSGAVGKLNWDGNACDYLLTEQGRKKAYAPQPPPPVPIGPVKRKQVDISPFLGDDII